MYLQTYEAIFANMSTFTTIEEYITTFPESTQTVLQNIRKTIAEVAPKAEECVNFQMSTFKLYGNLVHFAAYKRHVGFYPGPSAIIAFKDEIANYKYAKSSIQFSLAEEIPYDLIRRITKFRVKENLLKG